MSATIIKEPEVKIDSKLLHELKTQTHERGQVVLHFLYFSFSLYGESRIRIWPTTYLYDQHSSHRSEMVHAEKITMYPEWQVCKPGNNYFSLIFSGLPDDCKIFDFIELCDNQSGAFQVKNIKRNSDDVYFLMMA